MRWANALAAGGVLAALNALWLFMYSRMGIEFDTFFDFGAAFGLVDATTIFVAGFIGMLLSAAILALLYISRSLPRNEAVTAALLGTGVSAIAGAFFFGSRTIFLVMMAFYVAGSAYMASTPEPELKGIISKMRTAWNAQRKVMFVVALGGLFVGVVFTQANLPQYQEQVKSSLLNMTTLLVGGNASGLVSLDDVRQIVVSSELTRDQALGRMEASCAATPSCASLSPSDKATFLESQTDKYMQDQAASREYRVQTTYSDMQSRFSGNQTAQMVGNMFNRLPIMRTAMTLLPLLAGVMAFSTILFLETLFVAPFSILFSLMLDK